MTSLLMQFRVSQCLEVYQRVYSLGTTAHFIMHIMRCSYVRGIGVPSRILITLGLPQSL